MKKPSSCRSQTFLSPPSVGHPKPSVSTADPPPQILYYLYRWPSILNPVSSSSFSPPSFLKVLEQLLPLSTPFYTLSFSTLVPSPKFWASPVNFKSSSSLSCSLEEPCWYPDGAGTISKSRISTAIELDEPLIGNEAPKLLWVGQPTLEIGGFGTGGSWVSSLILELLSSLSLIVDPMSGFLR